MANDELMRRIADALERSEAAYERSVGVIERNTVAFEGMMAPLRDLQDEIRATTQAVFRVLDRLDGTSSA